MATSDRREVLVIVGPTASGKSRVALELAKKIDGEIINADSRQIYKYLDVGTSKPTSEERKLVPHHLYDFLDPKELYNAGEYSKNARVTIKKIFDRKRVPILVGGTGFYIQALLDGLADLPRRDDFLREKFLKIVERYGKKYLHEKLEKADPASAQKIPFQNVQRVIRALEVYTLTQKPISQWNGKNSKREHAFQPVFFGLCWKKTELKERIFQRTEKILPGLASEAEWLLKNGCNRNHPGMQSLGYRHAIRFLQKEISYHDFFNSLLLDTMHYAKRQMTWFKRDARIRWLDLEKPFQPEKVAETVIGFLI